MTGNAIPGPYFGYGRGRVWMSDVNCNGTEHDVSQCGYDASGGVNCDHSRDAGVICDCKLLNHCPAEPGYTLPLQTL